MKLKIKDATPYWKAPRRLVAPLSIYIIYKGACHVLLEHPEMNENFDRHREERSDVTIPNGIASINTFGIIEAMPLWIATHSFGMLAMTN